MPDEVFTLGHSPDPDDAFMFYALAQDPPLIPTGPYRFEHVLQDIQTLNQRAMQGDLEITAISIHAYPYVWMALPPALRTRKSARGLATGRSRFPAA